MKQIPKQSSFAWGKVAGMFFAVLIPALLVAYCSYLIFPDSWGVAIGMVLVSVGIAGIFTVASSKATPNVRRYCLIAHIVLAVTISAGLALHWIVKRQVSGARQATVERHTEEDRLLHQYQTQVDGAVKLVDAQKSLYEAQSKTFRNEAIRNDSAKRLGIEAPRGAKVTNGASMDIPKIEAPKLDRDTNSKKMTIEAVLEYWTPWLMASAILDLLASVISFGVCMALWEWDKDGDGVADHKQQHEPGKVHFHGSRDFHVLPDGRKRVVASTYDPNEVGQIWPDEVGK